MNNMRIGGLATGMDLEGLVKDMMKVQQAKADKMAQQKTRTQWQQEAYQDVNKTFANFILDTQKSFGLIKTGSAGFTKQSVSSLDWVKSAVSGDKSIVETSARADSVAGTYQIDVKELATNWSAASTDEVGKEISLGGGTVDFTINGWRFSTSTIEELNESGTGQVDPKKYIHISSNGGKVKMSDVAKAINTADIGVAANYDAGVGRFFLQTTNTGEKNAIAITDNSEIIDKEGNSKRLIAGDVVGEGEDKIIKDSILNLQHKVGDGTAFIENGATYKGQDAVVDFGAATGLKFSSNKFTLNGINFNVKAKGETSVTVGTDVDGVFDKIVDFVNQYNELLDQTQGLLREKKVASYLPLTDEQRSQLSEKEIEKWEERAKMGLLNRDMYLTQIMQQTRSGVYEEVKGASGGKHLISNFGITTQKYVAGSMGGKLEIDELKLKEAIREDVDSVLELFFSQPDSSVTDKKEQRAQTGIVSRLYNDLTEGMKGIINKAGPGEDAALYRNVDSRMLLDFVVEQGSISYLEKDISKLNTRISDFQAQMLRVENRYWAQFTAMEKAINQLNAQGAWLSQQFGGGM